MYVDDLYFMNIHRYVCMYVCTSIPDRSRSTLDRAHSNQSIPTSRRLISLGLFVFFHNIFFAQHSFIHYYIMYVLYVQYIHTYIATHLSPDFPPSYIHPSIYPSISSSSIHHNANPTHPSTHRRTVPSRQYVCTVYRANKQPTS